MRALLVVAVISTPALAQFCPSFTASSPNNTGDCAIEAVKILDRADRAPK